MNLAAISTELRMTSDRYDGIPDYLHAAGQLDLAASKFFLKQDTESLRDLTAAVARAERLRKGTVVARTGIEPVFPA